MEHLTAVMYRSQSLQPMDPGQLDRLLTASRAYNAMVNVSGVLLHDRGTFLQYFEGPAEAVEQVYARIRHSRLHGQMVQLMFGAVSKRQFASWHMGFSAAPATVLEEIGAPALDDVGMPDEDDFDYDIVANAELGLGDIEQEREQQL